jgi:hypothetical protein
MTDPVSSSWWTDVGQKVILTIHQPKWTIWGDNDLGTLGELVIGYAPTTAIGVSLTLMITRNLPCAALTFGHWV